VAPRSFYWMGGGGVCKLPTHRHACATGWVGIETKMYVVRLGL